MNQRKIFIKNDNFHSHSEDICLLSEIGFFSMAKGCINLSTIIFENLQILCPEEPVGFVGSAMNCMLTERHVQAEDILLSALRKIDKKKGELFLYLSLCYFLKKQYAKSEKLVEELLASSSLTGGHFNLASRLKEKCSSHRISS
jgi:tetratricopeptide (TPR) repeat protein